MRLGMNGGLQADGPEDWAQKMADLGVRAVAFPVTFEADMKTIDAYAEAIRANDIVIAEVGAWCNPLCPDQKVAEEAEHRCIEQLKLADYLGANCACNITGADGPIWDGWYPGNYSPAFYDKIVTTTQRIIEKAAPKNTCWSLEPMPNMVPAGPDEYLKLMEDVGSEHLKAHLDIINWMNSFDRFLHQREFMDDVFAKMHGKIVSCHFKDIILKQELTFQIVEAPVGDGLFDIDYYVKKVNEEDPELPLMIEHQPNDEAYIRSMKFVTERYKDLI